MKYAVVCIMAILLTGCNEETYQRIQFNSCVNGAKESPAYAEVVKACADTAIKLREQSKAKKEAA